MLQEDDVLPRATSAAIFVSNKLGESTENKKALLFYSGKK